MHISKVMFFVLSFFASLAAIAVAGAIGKKYVDEKYDNSLLGKVAQTLER